LHVLVLAQVRLQEPVAQVKVHDCWSLQAHFGPHSPVVGAGAPVSGGPLSTTGGAGIGVVEVAVGGAPGLSLPIVQSYEHAPDAAPARDDSATIVKRTMWRITRSSIAVPA
jgi:hypothetical protein